jgi:integrase
MYRRAHVGPAKHTLGEYITAWLRDVAATEVKEATLKSYTVRVKVDVIDRIGGLKLDKVTPQVIQALYSDLSRRGLSPRIVRYTHTVLNSALKTAVAWKLIRDNPCQHVALPKATHTEMDVWGAEETNAFLRSTGGTRDHALWYTLLNTGMRPSEAFGLKWEDLDGDRLRIQRAIAETMEQGRLCPGSSEDRAIEAVHRDLSGPCSAPKGAPKASGRRDPGGWREVHATGVRLCYT